MSESLSSSASVAASAAPAARVSAGVSPEGALEWHGLGRPRWRRRWRRFSWQELLWGLLLPEKRQRVLPTASGMILLVLVLAIGMAAYNTGNNILFLTLALLLSSLVLSGVLAWLNFSGTEWRVRPALPFRVGQEAAVAVELRSRKRVLPTYALWFDLEARLSQARTRLFLRRRLEVGGTDRLEWTFRPSRRGIETLELSGVGSLFPFGFLRKTMGATVRTEVRVWPARVACHFGGAAAARFQRENEELSRPGGGSDLLGLRRYRAGDSHRHIHWKASARMRQLLVRQHAAEAAMTFALWLDSSAAVWTRPEQFELLCSFAGSLAEDLFRAGRLDSVAVDNEPAQLVRRIRDVDTWLDRLAVLEPGVSGQRRRGLRVRGALLTFEPDGERGIRARLGNEIAARI
ncbi:MAG: DUF58 domain-containing protein [Opitutaceae bacterium]